MNQAPGQLSFLTPGKTPCQNPFSHLKVMIFFFKVMILISAKNFFAFILQG